MGCHFAARMCLGSPQMFSLRDELERVREEVKNVQEADRQANEAKRLEREKTEAQRVEAERVEAEAERAAAEISKGETIQPKRQRPFEPSLDVGCLGTALRSVEVRVLRAQSVTKLRNFIHLRSLTHA